MSHARVFIAMAIGGVLIAAGVLKAMEPSPAMIYAAAFLPAELAPFAVAAVCLLELSLGIGLCLAPRNDHLLAGVALLMSAFAVMAALAPRDLPSCGCFGGVAVDSPALRGGRAILLPAGIAILAAWAMTSQHTRRRLGGLDRRLLQPHKGDSSC